MNLGVAAFEAGIGRVGRRSVAGAVLAVLAGAFLGDDGVATKHFCLMNENVTAGCEYIPRL